MNAPAGRARLALAAAAVTAGVVLAVCPPDGAAPEAAAATHPAAAAAPKARTTLVSSDAHGRRAGDPADEAHALSPAISGDGRWVAFASAAPLVPGVAGAAVYLRDRSTGALTVVSRAPVEVVGGIGRQAPEVSISDDGRYVGFDSTSDQLDGRGTPLDADVAYLYDRLARSMRRVGAPRPGYGQGALRVGFVGGGHRYAFFDGPASDAPGRAPAEGLHLLDLTRGTSALLLSPAAQQHATVDLSPDATTLVAASSKDLAGDGRGGGTFSRGVTGRAWARLRALPGRFVPLGLDVAGPRGRYVVFDTDQALVRSDRNRARDVYRWDTATGALGVVSVTSAGASCVAPGPGQLGPLAFAGSAASGVSADGRTVLFSSTCVNLTGRKDAGDGRNLFVRDTRLHTTRGVDVTPAGRLSDGGAVVDADGLPLGWQLSADGRWVAFAAGDRTLVGERRPRGTDPVEVYVRGPLR